MNVVLQGRRNVVTSRRSSGKIAKKSESAGRSAKMGGPCTSSVTITRQEMSWDDSKHTYRVNNKQNRWQYYQHGIEHLIFLRVLQTIGECITLNISSNRNVWS